MLLNFMIIIVITVKWNNIDAAKFTVIIMIIK